VNYDEFLELVKTRRSVRRYKTDPIPDGYVEKVIEAARWAPSGANGQPWEFIVVKDAATKLKIAEAHAKIRTEQYYIEQTRLPELQHLMLTSFPEGLPEAIIDAPVLIVVCGDRRVTQTSVLSAYFMSGEGSVDGVYLKNIANATYSLLLAATALGIGSQWFSMVGQLEELLKPILGVPPFIQLHTIVPLGYPEKASSPGSRRDLKDLIHYEKYDMARYRTGDKIIDYIRNARKAGRARQH
jgi:5,6-dimethylbenzimidazole synthase